MAAPYYIWDGAGGGGGTGADWANAFVSVAAAIVADAAAFTTSGNIIYFSSDHNDPNKAAPWTLTGPTSGLPVIMISADRTNATPTYKTGTGAQLSSLGGAYSITFDGSFALYGLWIVGGSTIQFSSDGDEGMLVDRCTLVTAANTSISLSGISAGITRIYNCIVDLTADATTGRAAAVFLGAAVSSAQIQGLTFVNAGYRTGSVFGVTSVAVIVDGANLSGFTNGTTCEIFSAIATYAPSVATNCLTAATWTPVAGAPTADVTELTLTNCGPADAPTYLYYTRYRGTAASSSSIYRTGGATVEGEACSWLITTTANCAEGAPFYTPWVYFAVDAAGTKAISCFVTNDAADLTNAEAWIEVEALSTADEAIYALTTNRRATITTTAAAQTDDTTSGWNGAGPAYTYMQSLSASVVVGEAGLCRARVAFGKASMAAASYYYLDPCIYIDGIKAGAQAVIIPGVGISQYNSAHPRFGDRTGGLR